MFLSTDDTVKHLDILTWVYRKDLTRYSTFRMPVILLKVVETIDAIGSTTQWQKSLILTLFMYLLICTHSKFK